MCSLTAGLGLISTVIGAMGQMQQAKASAAASRYNAQVGEMNAKISERRAKDAIERGQKEEQKDRMRSAQLKGAQIAAMAANGVDVGYGSPLDTISDTAMLAEVDALTIRRNAAWESYDYRVQAENQRAGANLDRMNARAAERGGFLAAAGTVLGGFGNAFGEYRKSRIGAIA